VRDVERLKREAALTAEINQSHAVILLQVRNDLGSRTANVPARRASRDRQGRALESLLWRRRGAAFGRRDAGHCGLSCGLQFDYARTRPRRPLAKSASRQKKPAKIKSPPPRAFPSDTTSARAIVCRCGRRLVSRRRLRRSNTPKYFELNRGTKLPEATLYSWDNATGDPEIFAGYLLIRRCRSRVEGQWTSAEGHRSVRDRRLQQAHRGYRALNKTVVEAGATIPLLQSC